MGQSPSSFRSKGSRQRSFRGFMRRSKLNKSNLSHTFSLPPSEEYPELMNVNTASEEQLMTLPGVNRQLARSIVAHRQIIGRFKRVDDLALVSGIGAEKLELLRPEICTHLRKTVSRTSSCTLSLDSLRLSTENKLLSVNSSSVFQLQCVPGLNQELAANIVDYRDKKGPFKSLDDLIKVRGIDIVRLSTVKQHLSLEPRKCESMQHLPNTLVNGWSDKTSKELIPNGMTSAPRTPHRKSLSMPTKFPITLPNGFATAPVNDILDLLSAYSHRPIVEEVFTYERDGVRCCRIASWNLHQLSIDKVMNPGVREVVCRTILEHKLSIIAVQEVLDEAALKIICDELNAPGLRRVKEWKSNSQRWEYCILEQTEKLKLGFIYDASNKGIIIEDIDIEQMCLITEGGDIQRLAGELNKLRSERYVAAPQVFLLCGRPVILVNVYCKERLSAEDSLQIDSVVALADKCGVTVALVGEFHSWDNVHTLKANASLLKDETVTTVDPKAISQTTILHQNNTDKSQFNGYAGVIKSGLSHLAIPKGWSWGGPASPYCPVWAEIKVPD